MELRGGKSWSAQLEYTLEDAFETLKDKKAQREQDIENLTNVISNNDIPALKSSSSLEDIKMKQLRLREGLLKMIAQVEPDDYPIPRTADLRGEVMTELEEEIHDMVQLLGDLECKLADIQENITYLKNKKSGLEKMRDACLDITETFANRTYEKEYALVKRMFQQVKQDLHVVVDTIFPNNSDFKEVLAKLTAAYMKSGDDTYIDVTPQNLRYVTYLVESDIVQYHRNDRNKIRIVELL